MPTAETETGKTMASHLPERPMEEPRTKAAQVVSAKEPKRSEPMPATSPTLSAVVLGDAVRHLSDEVGADVDGLGVDAAAGAAGHSQQHE